MKKFLKILAATAAVAAVIPLRGEGDENGGELEGLLWKATWKLDPHYQSEPDINITFGLNNPFKKANKESHLFADELVVDYCCDETLTHAPVHTETQLFTEEDFADEPETTGTEESETTECGCGEDCNCGCEE